jgi:hypothetical protein
VAQGLSEISNGHAGGNRSACLHRILFKFWVAVERLLSLTLVLLCVMHLSKMSPKARPVGNAVAAWSAPILMGMASSEVACT